MGKKKIAWLINKNTHRYQQNGYDLDLTYIMPNIIAMSYPGDGAESLFMNDIDDVARYLDEAHGNHYLVINLRVEAAYDAAKFHGRAIRIPLVDYEPPPINAMQPFCEQVDQWLSQNPENVVAVHCKAGKGRTGSMICCYLLYKRYFTDADSAIQFYASKRMTDSEMPIRPSQRRYVRYFGRLNCRPMSYKPPALRLCAVAFEAKASGILKSVNPVCFTAEDRGSNSVYSSDRFSTSAKLSNKTLLVIVKDPPFLIGDVKLRFFQKQLAKKRHLFSLWFNTNFTGSSLAPLPLPQSANGATDAMFCSRTFNTDQSLDGFVINGGNCFEQDVWHSQPCARRSSEYDGSRQSGPSCFVSVVSVGNTAEPGPWFQPGPIGSSRAFADRNETPRTFRTMTFPGQELDKVPRYRKRSPSPIFTDNFKVTLYLADNE